MLFSISRFICATYPRRSIPGIDSVSQKRPSIFVSLFTPAALLIPSLLCMTCCPCLHCAWKTCSIMNSWHWSQRSRTELYKELVSSQKTISHQLCPGHVKILLVPRQLYLPSAMALPMFAWSECPMFNRRCSLNPQWHKPALRAALSHVHVVEIQS